MLYIYSDDVPELDMMLREVLGARHRLTVIPASPRDRPSARHQVAALRHAGLHARLQSTRAYRDPVCLRNIVFNSDAVYLMGGNTFEFLAYARVSGLFPILHEYEMQGGIIAADSAGSIILSPNIATALIPTTCPDEQLIELDGYEGMGRLPFHVSPHFDPSSPESGNEVVELQALADLSAMPVVVLQDGEGFVMNGLSMVHTHGQPLVLEANREAASVAVIPPYIPAWAVSVNRGA